MVAWIVYDLVNTHTNWKSALKDDAASKQLKVKSWVMNERGEPTVKETVIEPGISKIEWLCFVEMIEKN